MSQTIQRQVWHSLSTNWYCRGEREGGSGVSPVWEFIWGQCPLFPKIKNIYLKNDNFRHWYTINFIFKQLKFNVTCMLKILNFVNLYNQLPPLCRPVNTKFDHCLEIFPKMSNLPSFPQKKGNFVNWHILYKMQ